MFIEQSVDRVVRDLPSSGSTSPRAIHTIADELEREVFARFDAEAKVYLHAIELVSASRAIICSGL